MIFYSGFRLTEISAWKRPDADQILKDPIFFRHKYSLDRVIFEQRYLPKNSEETSNFSFLVLDEQSTDENRT